MFTFHNLFAGAAGLCLIMLGVHLVAGGGLGGASIWANPDVCASNACNLTGERRARPGKHRNG